VRKRVRVWGMRYVRDRVRVGARGTEDKGKGKGAGFQFREFGFR
jgi:hypothetical protein